MLVTWIARRCKASRKFCAHGGAHTLWVCPGNHQVRPFRWESQVCHQESWPWEDSCSAQEVPAWPTTPGTAGERTAAGPPLCAGVMLLWAVLGRCQQWSSRWEEEQSPLLGQAGLEGCGGVVTAFWNDCQLNRRFGLLSPTPPRPTWTPSSGLSGNLPLKSCAAGSTYSQSSLCSLSPAAIGPSSLFGVFLFLSFCFCLFWFGLVFGFTVYSPFCLIGLCLTSIIRSSHLEEGPGLNSLSYMPPKCLYIPYVEFHNKGLLSFHRSPTTCKWCLKSWVWAAKFHLRKVNIFIV